MGIDRLVPPTGQVWLWQPHRHRPGIRVLPSRNGSANALPGKRHPEAARVDPADVVPIGIGQATTLTPRCGAAWQAILANDGVVYRPHVVMKPKTSKPAKVTKVEARPTRPATPGQSRLCEIRHGSRVQNPRTAAAALAPA